MFEQKIPLCRENATQGNTSGSFVTKIAIVYAQEMAMSMPNDPLGMIFDYDALGNIVSLEILDASQRVLSPIQIEYQVLTPAVV